MAPRRWPSSKWIARLAFCAALSLSASAAMAADFPERAIHLVVGYSPGGAADFLARLLARDLEAQLGQPVVVDNRPGAGTTIAASYVARANPDGYTLLVYGEALTVPFDFKVNFDRIRSFTPISLVAEQPDFLAVNPTVPVASLKSLIDYAKANPGKLRFGVTGAGTPNAAMIQVLAQRTGINVVDVPYTGESAFTTALLGNEVQSTWLTFQTMEPLMKDGKVKVLAVTSNVRSPQAPDIPTVVEAAGLSDFDITIWYGIAAPAGLPDPVARKLHDAVAAALAMPDLQHALSEAGMIQTGGSAQDFTAKIEHDLALWSSLGKGPSK